MFNFPQIDAACDAAVDDGNGCHSGVFDFEPSDDAARGVIGDGSTCASCCSYGYPNRYRRYNCLPKASAISQRSIRIQAS